jgi:hypothetical protein
VGGSGSTANVGGLVSFVSLLFLKKLLSARNNVESMADRVRLKYANVFSGRIKKKTPFHTG